jgi:imidazolonepropionase-like amidohydrolase
MKRCVLYSFFFLSCSLSLAGARAQGGLEGEYIIKASKVWTMVGAPLAPGFIHIRGGKIIAVGKTLPATNATIPVLEYLDGEVIPGLVELHSHIALRGNPRRSGESNERSQSFSPELNVLDGFDPYDAALHHAVSGGVTTLLVTTGSFAIVSGQSALLKLKPPPLSQMLLRTPSGVKATSWQKQTYSELDKWLSTAQKAMENKDEVQDPKTATGIRLLRREIPLIVHGAYPTGEIEPALAIADKYHLRMIIYHCESCDENYEEIAARKIPVVVGPRITYWNRDRMTNLPSFLARHGILVALGADASNAQERYLLDEAGLAVHYGMGVEDALKAITINPATMIGIADRVGSLEVGKDADMVILSGPVFAAKTRVVRVIIEGVTQYEAH